MSKQSNNSGSFFRDLRDIGGPLLKEFIVYSIVILIILLAVSFANNILKDVEPNKNISGFNETVVYAGFSLFIFHFFASLLSYRQKDNFWAIRPTFKASVIRGTELLVLMVYLFFSQFLIPKENVFFWFEKNLLYEMVIGILIITSFSFIFYKSYDKLAERIKKKRQQTWNDVKEMSKYLVFACFYRMKRFYKNTTAK